MFAMVRNGQLRIIMFGMLKSAHFSNVYSLYYPAQASDGSDQQLSSR